MKSYLEKFRLDGKVACVVGGLGLIGTEISTVISEAGATTLILDIETVKGNKLVNELTKNGYKAEFICFDVTDLEKISEKLIHTYKIYNQIDIFINCSYPRTNDWCRNNFKHISLESFRLNVDLHMNSYAWSAREAAELMSKQNNGGSIVLLGSIYGVLGQDLTVYEGTNMNENMSYATIKGGITNLVRQMASYYGRYNIRINTLCPGGVLDDQNQTFIKNYSHKTPLKRMANPEEIASAALFLTSEAASYISGITLLVDGGYTNI